MLYRRGEHALYNFKLYSVYEMEFKQRLMRKSHETDYIFNEFDAQENNKANGEYCIGKSISDPVTGAITTNGSYGPQPVYV